MSATTQVNENEPQTEPGRTTRDGLCGICPAGCWVRVTLENGKMVGVEPQPDHPLGMLCTNGERAPDIVYDPERLRYPLRRVGPKGSYEFERISWDEAMQAIADRFQSIKQEHGAEATAIYTGRGSFELALCDTFQPREVPISSASSVLFPFGSPNTLGVGALCYVSFAMIAPHVTFGEYYITLDFDVEQAELIVIWGSNPATDSPPLLHEKIRQARERGAEVVVIDPQRNDTARAVDAEWVPIRPGTDGALALGMIQVLIEEELYDEAFVEQWTVGWEELVQYAQHFRPEVVEGITGVPADTVVSLARRIARARGAAPVTYTGLEYSDSGVQAIRALFTLWAAAGQLDVPGGLAIRMKDHRFPINREGLLENPAIHRALGRDRFPVYSAYRGESHAISLPDSVLHGDPYQIRGLIILGGSIITAWPEPKVFRETLAGLDFLVCIDRHLTADAAYADIVLPATTGFEIDSYMTYGPLFKLRERVIEPVGEARDDYHIMTELAERLGYGHLFPQNDEERLRHALKGSGFSLEQVREAGGEARVPTSMMQYKKWEKGMLRPDGKPGFDTPSGKFEIRSSILEEHGYEPLPVYTEPKEGPQAQPDLARQYPLVFNSGARIFGDFRSQHHGVKSLQRLAPEPLVTLHETDAAERGIGDGDRVLVKSPRGSVAYRARVTTDIVRGAIEANMGGGGPLGSEAWRQCNVNELTDLSRYDPISGFPLYKSLLCEVERLEDGNGRARPRPTTSRADSPASNPRAQKSAEPERRIYLDHNATTAVREEVLEAILPYLKQASGNPSSVHTRGAAARDAVEDARRRVARALNCTARRIVFTGGGSEANNLALKGACHILRPRGRHVVTSRVEHPAVLKTCQALAEDGFEVTVLPVDARGRVSPDDFAAAIRPDTIVASIMFANNEVSTVEPIAELAQIARKNNVLFHTDAVQALGRVPLDVQALDVDLLSISGHKVGAPKGIGALYVRRGVELAPLIHGGGQERGLRSGTENVPGIVGLGKACDLLLRELGSGVMRELAALRDEIEARLLELVPDAKVNGDTEHRLANTLSMVLPGLRGESLVLFLDRHGVYFSSGSACKSGNAAPSHVLRAIGLSDEEAHCTIRLSLGATNTRNDIRYVLDAFEQVLQESRNSVRFVACR